MTLFGKHVLHRWTPITQPYEKEFMGRKCPDVKYTGFRICRECHQIEEYFYDSQGGYWWTLPPCERQALFDSVTIESNGRRVTLKEKEEDGF